MFKEFVFVIKQNRHQFSRAFTCRRDVSLTLMILAVKQMTLREASRQSAGCELH
jgi:hypothetical protein